MGSRLLIAAGEAASSPAGLPFGIRELISAADEILVITPSLPGLASATDKAQEQADARLHAVLGQLDALGAEARGAVGSDDPLEALADAVREFAPDHLLLVLRAGDRAGWQERGLLDQAHGRFALPMTVFSLT